MSDVGLSLVRGVSNGLVGVQTPDLNTVALLMRRPRGVVNKVYEISNTAEDELAFGASTSGYLGAEAVRELLNNAAPASPLILASRITPEDIDVAKVAISTGVFSGTTVSAGQKGEEDPGSWGNDMYVEFSSYTESPTGEVDVVNPFILSVFEDSTKVNLLEEYLSSTVEDIETQVQANSKYITLNPFAASTARDAVGFTEMDALGAVTGDVSGTWYGETQLWLAGLDINAIDAAGGRHAIFAVGTPLYFDDAGTRTRIGTIAQRYFSSVGTDYRITIILSSPRPVGLTYTTLGVDYSTLKSDVASGKLIGGVNGTESEVDAYPTIVDNLPHGLSVFSGLQFKVATVLGYFTLEMHTQGATWASNNNQFYVGMIKEDATDADLSEFLALRNASFSNIALYNSWSKAYIGHSKEYGWMPSTAQVLGAGFIRSPYVKGGGIQYPPAGVDSAFVGITDSKPVGLAQHTINKYVQDWGINVAVKNQNLGVWLVSSRTTSSNPLYHSIHIALQANYYSTILTENMSWMIQVPNTPALRNQASAYLTSFFGREYESGAIENSIPFSEAVKIRVTQNVDNRKQVDIYIEYIPTEAVESVVIYLMRNDGALIADIQ